ncbi:hypothetical protein WKT22_01221 [Candidatus Lokiarchaeum ossiferum]
MKFKNLKSNVILLVTIQYWSFFNERVELLSMATSIKTKSEKKLLGISLECGSCQHAKSITAINDKEIEVDCWSCGPLIFDITSTDVSCKNKEIKNLCPNLLLLSRK